MLAYFENVKTAIKELPNKGFSNYLLSEMRDYWVDPLNGDYAGSIANLRTKILSLLILNKDAASCVLARGGDRTSRSVVECCDNLRNKI